MKAILIAAVGISLAGTAAALDLGDVGPVYPIAEPDFEEQMRAIAARKVANGEWAAMEHALKRKAESGLTEPVPITGIATATRKRTWLFDPSVSLTRAITLDGGQVLYPAGTKVNPLEVVSLNEPLLFFDARDARQLQFAGTTLQHENNQLKMILVAGNLRKAANTLHHAVYFDQGGDLTRRLGIHAVPALVTQEDKQLRIQEIVP